MFFLSNGLVVSLLLLLSHAPASPPQGPPNGAPYLLSRPPEKARLVEERVDLGIAREHEIRLRSHAPGVTLGRVRSLQGPGFVALYSKPPRFDVHDEDGALAATVDLDPQLLPQLDWSAPIAGEARSGWLMRLRPTPTGLERALHVRAEGEVRVRRVPFHIHAHVGGRWVGSIRTAVCCVAPGPSWSADVLYEPHVEEEAYASARCIRGGNGDRLVVLETHWAGRQKTWRTVRVQLTVLKGDGRVAREIALPEELGSLRGGDLRASRAVLWGTGLWLLDLTSLEVTSLSKTVFGEAVEPRSVRFTETGGLAGYWLADDRVQTVLSTELP